MDGVKRIPPPDPFSGCPPVREPSSESGLGGKAVTVCGPSRPRPIHIPCQVKLGASFHALHLSPAKWWPWPTGNGAPASLRCGRKKKRKKKEKKRKKKKKKKKKATLHGSEAPPFLVPRPLSRTPQEYSLLVLSRTASASPWSPLCRTAAEGRVTVTCVVAGSLWLALGTCRSRPSLPLRWPRSGACSLHETYRSVDSCRLGRAGRLC